MKYQSTDESDVEADDSEREGGHQENGHKSVKATVKK
jgi:hypothetical protein